jgi:hypothetical protein
MSNDADAHRVKAAITGLLGFAATEEQVLLAAAPPDEASGAEHWASLPVVAHNTEFKSQQVQRLLAIREGQVPEEFAEVDHASAELYARYASQSIGEAAADSNRVTGELINELRLVSAEDLFDPSRHPWLKGRKLWLQIVVRGFWHPTGHLMEYYLGHGLPDRAVAMAAHALATARYLAVPAEACGMASYNLACAEAGAGHLDDAVAAVREAIALNPDLRGKVATEPDLAALRERGLLESAGQSWAGMAR